MRAVGRALCLLLLLAAAGAAAIALVDGNARQQALAWAQHQVHAADSALSSMTAATPAPSGTPTVPRIVLHPAAPTPTPPAPTPTATVPPAPAATPTALAPYSVSAADYAWAVQTLTLDHTLDVAAESRFPSEAAYYTTIAAHWASCVLWLEVAAKGQLTQAQEISDATTLPPQWFTLAAETHVADEQRYPQNTQWDDTWRANYARLLTIWGQL